MSTLGELEQRVMEVVWARADLTVREVAEALRGDVDRAYTTVMTTLDRLHRKGLVARRKDGLAWRYGPALDRAAWERQCADRLAAALLARGDAGLAALVDAPVDASVLDRLEALLRARRGAL